MRAVFVNEDVVTNDSGGRPPEPHSMQMLETVAVRNAKDFPDWQFDTLDIEYDAATASVWMYYRADSPDSYTPHMLAEIACVRESLRALADSEMLHRFPLRYFVMASKKPNIFSFGGDLAYFAQSIKARDLDTLYAYGRLAIDVIYGLASAFDLPLITLSAVNGQCLGGGFEGALSTDFMIVQRSAKLGLPEVSFNSFPGMGAVSLLARRIGLDKAEKMITSGAAFSGVEAYELGIAHCLAPDDALRETTRQWMLEGGEDRWRRRLLITTARRRLFPISREELTEIVDLWAECSHAVSPHDLRHIERLVAAQKRKRVVAGAC
jgi:DSF synthase